MLLLLAMPSTGTLILALVLALIAAFSGLQWRQKQSLRLTTEQAQADVSAAERATHGWKSTAEAGAVTVKFAESELREVRERCSRLEEIGKTQTEELATLRARTDLNALSQALASEAQRAQQMHEAILHGLQNVAVAVGEMSKRDAERDEQYATIINSQSELIKSLQSQMNLKEALRKAG